ncbi:hypothetical protein JKP88DRAFT_273672 [Tribonema minus]|uniref:Uncharacterized protein n=1 Tax=Tribonema minus TaxID=303371 RepID=A0A835YR19_9STRA|nr:hypothetical protein JKP88DRAFT_273672 [Tribonema minus]
MGEQEQGAVLPDASPASKNRGAANTSHAVSESVNAHLRAYRMTMATLIIGGAAGVAFVVHRRGVRGFRSPLDLPEGYFVNRRRIGVRVVAAEGHATDRKDGLQMVTLRLEHFTPARRLLRLLPHKQNEPHVAPTQDPGQLLLARPHPLSVVTLPCLSTARLHGIACTQDGHRPAPALSVFARLHGVACAPDARVHGVACTPDGLRWLLEHVAVSHATGVTATAELLYRQRWRSACAAAGAADGDGGGAGEAGSSGGGSGGGGGSSGGSGGGSGGGGGSDDGLAALRWGSGDGDLNASAAAAATAQPPLDSDDVLAVNLRYWDKRALPFGIGGYWWAWPHDAGIHLIKQGLARPAAEAGDDALADETAFDGRQRWPFLPLATRQELQRDAEARCRAETVARRHFNGLWARSDEQGVEDGGAHMRAAALAGNAAAAAKLAGGALNVAVTAATAGAATVPQALGAGGTASPKGVILVASVRACQSGLRPDTDLKLGGTSAAL